jgi:RadC-like JAB domain
MSIALRSIWPPPQWCSFTIIRPTTQMPSPEDQEITRRLKECGEMLAIRVLDHVILGGDRYYSFSDRGLL